MAKKSATKKRGAKKAPKPQPIELPLKITPMEGFGGGFRQEWISGKSPDGTKVALESGAGLGNPLLTFRIERPGQKPEWWTADMADLLQRWAKEVA